MTAATHLRPVAESTVEPAIEQEFAALNPTATRYGWNPFREINLTSNGSISLYVQPHTIQVGDRIVDNPLHRLLPRAQLIPFPTFNAVHTELSPDIKDSKGAAVPIQTTRSVSALEAIAGVLRDYSGWGFMMLESLTGMEQAQATRIFRVVHPFEYRLVDFPQELTIGAEQRIQSTESIVFEMGPDQEDYVVAPLRSDDERRIARALASEMQNGAATCIAFAEQVFFNTDTNIRARLAGAKEGKFAPDPLDAFVAEQLGKDYVSLAGVNTAAPDNGLTDKVDFLVNREIDRDKDQRIRELEAQLAAKNGTKANKAPQAAPELVRDAEVAQTTENVSEAAQKPKMGYCGRTTKAGTECRSITKNGEPCDNHKTEAELAAEDQQDLAA